MKLPLLGGGLQACRSLVEGVEISAEGGIRTQRGLGLLGEVRREGG